MKLYNSFKTLILEMVADENITDAIRNKKIVTIYYLGDENEGRGYRDIEIYTFGVSTRGNKVISAFQLDGSSKTASDGTQPLPGWRTFRLDRIQTYKPTLNSFSEPKPGFNPNGHKKFSKILKIFKRGENE
jgi:predicted DNA-binding transcriptional regulator YafY